MSLETLDRKIENLRADATSRISGYRQFVAGVNTDPTLTAAGKAQKLAGSKERTKEEVAALKAQEDTAIADEIRNLERAIGGTAGATGANVISFRDAQDRANRVITPAEALNGLRAAITTDDRELARAYLMRAVTEQDQDPVARALSGIGADVGDWSTLVREYINAYPNSAQAVTDLFELRRRERSTQHMFLSAGAYVVL